MFLRNLLVSYCTACLCVRGGGHNHDRVALSTYSTVEITAFLVSTRTNMHILYNLLCQNPVLVSQKWKKKRSCTFAGAY